MGQRHLLEPDIVVPEVGEIHPEPFIFTPDRGQIDIPEPYIAETPSDSRQAALNFGKDKNKRPCQEMNRPSLHFREKK